MTFFVVGSNEIHAMCSGFFSLSTAALYARRPACLLRRRKEGLRRREYRLLCRDLRRREGRLLLGGICYRGARKIVDIPSSVTDTCWCRARVLTHSPVVLLRQERNRGRSRPRPLPTREDVFDMTLDVGVGEGAAHVVLFGMEQSDEAEQQVARIVLAGRE